MILVKTPQVDKKVKDI